MKQTPLYAEHVAAGGKMVDFAGWQMPLHYGSQLQEHNQVRREAGQFDVSHMTVIDVLGSEAAPFLRRAVANNVDKLTQPGRALYGVLLNPQAGVVDDLIVYRRNSSYRLVVNAGTRAKVLAWLALLSESLDGAASKLRIVERADLAIIAVQGPHAIQRCVTALPQTAVAASLKPFRFKEVGDWLIARTGYTGEDGFELILPNTEALACHRALLAAGVPPIGLAARDTLRLEAGLNLYGQDMDETLSPLVSNLGWTIAWEPQDREFVGRVALQAQRDSNNLERLVGVVLEDRGVLRAGLAVVTNAGSGVITSGAFSPTLGYSIGFARVPQGAVGEASVLIRKREFAVQLVKAPFVRKGQRAFKLL